MERCTTPVDVHARRREQLCVRLNELQQLYGYPNSTIYIYVTVNDVKY